MMMAWKLAPAIGGGNTVVFKPSEQTPLTALKLARILAEELPRGVVNVIAGRGETVGNALIHHDAVDMISLTGDVATGKKMLQAASKSVKRTHLELGGKAPVIVFDDADIEEVVSSLKIFGYYNAGQDCTAACRVYAAKGTYEKLVADLTSAVESIAYAEADDTENEIGPLISRRQRDRVASFVERARDCRMSRSRRAAPPMARAASTTAPPSSPARGRRTRSSSARSSAPSSRSRGSRTWIRRWPGPTIRTTASPRRSGRRTSAFRAMATGRVGYALPPWLHLDQHALHAGERDARTAGSSSRATAERSRRDRCSQ
jgi:hypothetical protein